MTNRIIVAAAVACALFAIAAGPATSPQAERIIRKHVAAMGGDRLEAVEAVHAEGEVEVNGVTAPFSLWRQRPDRSRLELSILGYDVVQAYDGKVAWWINPVVGAADPEPMPEEFAREVALWSDFTGPLVDYQRKRHRVKYEGKDMLETGEAHKLRVGLPGGGEVVVFIDAESYLEVRRTHTPTYQGKSITVNTYFSDFTAVDGVTIPQTIRGVGFGGAAFIMRFGRVTLDVEDDASRYEMPGGEKASRVPGY